MEVNVILSSVSANKCSLCTIIKIKKPNNRTVVSIYEGNTKFLDPTHHLEGPQTCK